MNESTILGITGAFGSGKSTASDFLTSHGYTRITLSQFLEEEAQKKNIPLITRKVLQDIGNELRSEFGSDILAKKASEYIKNNNITKAVIDGIRNIGEIEYLRKGGGFTLLAIVVNRSIRFERLKNLKRREDLTQELFNELDYRDLGLGEEKSGLQVALCTALADIFIDNNSTEEAFRGKLQEIL